CGACEAAGIPAGGHAAYEQTLVEEPLAHAYAVAEDRAASERRRRVDGDHRHAVVRRAVGARELVHERALATAGRARDADDLRVTGQRIERAQSLCGTGFVVLDDGKETRGRAFVAGPSALEQVGGGDGHEACRQVLR